MVEVKITEVEGKYQAIIGDWTSGPPSIMRTVNRRVKAQQKLLAEMEEREVKMEWVKNAPKKKCSRCKGKGYLAAYMHVAHGVCYKCGGDGEVIDQRKVAQNDGN